MVTENALGGISVDGVIRNSESRRNGGVGISIANQGNALDCVARGNSGPGFSGSGVFRNNTAADNEDFGVFVNPGGIARGNRVTGNGDGIRCNDCLAVGNNIFANTGNGIDFENTPAAYGGNLILDNGGSAVINAGSATQIATNACGSSPCP